jgi:hypothetical protein
MWCAAYFLCVAACFFVSRFALFMDRSLSLAMDPGLRQDDEQRTGKGKVRTMSFISCPSFRRRPESTGGGSRRNY